jgi:hypothetical protein
MKNIAKFWKSITLKDILTYSAILLFALLWLNSCNDTSKLEGQNIELTKDVESLKRQLVSAEKNYIKSKDSLEKRNKEAEENIAEKEKSISNKEKEITRLRKENGKLKKDVRAMKYTELAVFFGERYNQLQNAIALENGVTLSSNLPHLVAEDLVDGDLFEKENKVLYSIIDDKDVIIDEQAVMIDNKDVQLEGLESLYKIAKDLNSANDDLIDNQKKQIKKLNRSNMFLGIGVPTAVVLGFVAGMLVN